MIWIFLWFLLLKNSVFATEATASASIIINKFQYNPPLDKNEWVEIYNYTNNEINLNGWYFVDEKDNTKILDGKMIGATSTLIFDSGKNWLNNDFDTVFLKIGNSIVDQVKYKVTGKRIFINDVLLNDEYSDFKGKWLGRVDVGSTNWQVLTDTTPPIGGAINYFDGYKTVVENVGITIIPATDQSGIGVTNIITKMANLKDSICDNFMVDVGNSLVDGKCYKFEYVASDGVSNTSIFTSNSIVKFDTTKPILNFDNAFRNILKLKSVFGGVDPESGILKYKYDLSNLNCGSTIVPTDWSYSYNSILNIGYTGGPLALYGKAVNNALLESEINCVDFKIDVITPKIINQTNPENGKYKIGDKLKFSFEFDEDIDSVGSDFSIKLNTGSAKFGDKVDNILNFEYVVTEGNLTDNLQIGETKINVNGGQITDTAGNDADLSINNLNDGIIIDGIKPTIGLIGDTYIEVPQFGNYLDLGVTVSDGTITIDNSVNTIIGGIYEVKYVVGDNAGNNNSTVRKVKVVDTTAPTISKFLISNFKFLMSSDEDGYVEWQGKCDSENKSISKGNNIIFIKDNGDGIYNDCQIRGWDKWGNVSQWQTIDSFTVDTIAPIISFKNSSQTEISVIGDENLKSCTLKKEKIVTGDFETGNIDGWNGEWIGNNLHFVNGSWSAQSPDLRNEDLIEKSIWQTVDMESIGTLSYWWRVSSEKDWDYLKFYVDNILIDKISGEVGWQKQSFDLSTGNHTIKFTYSKDYSGESGEDAGWIDQVEITGNNIGIPMSVINNTAWVGINNLKDGVTKYKVNCVDFYNNESLTIETSVVKNIDKIITTIPTPYTIFKTSASIPTIKITKHPTIKINKKTPVVLGVATTPTPNLSINPTTTKLKSNIPWEEIKFWTMGMMVLGTTSGVIVLDKKKN